jgi:hypothetical protein
VSNRSGISSQSVLRVARYRLCCLGVGTIPGQRMKRSSAMRQYVYPGDVRRGPRGLCEREENGLSANGVIVLQETSESWQDWHAHVQVLQSFYA